MFEDLLNFKREEVRASMQAPVFVYQGSAALFLKTDVNPQRQAGKVNPQIGFRCSQAVGRVFQFTQDCTCLPETQKVVVTKQVWEVWCSLLYTLRALCVCFLLQETLNKSTSSRSLKSLETDSGETELERVLRRRKVTTDQDSGSKCPDFPTSLRVPALRHSRRFSFSSIALLFQP